MSSLVQRVPREGSVVPFLPVLCVGDGLSPELTDALAHEGVGVVTSYDSAGGMQLLKHFRVRAVICFGTDVRTVMAFADRNTPVILLADEHSEWTLPSVTVIGLQTPAPTLARLVREVAIGHGNSGFIAA